MIQTVTISINAFFQPSDETIINGLRDKLRGVTVLSVDRAFLSGRFAVTVENTAEFTASNLTSAFLWALAELGYSGEVLQIDTGRTSSQQGGISQAAEEAAATARYPLTMIAIAAVAIAAVYLTFKFKH